MGWFDDLRQRLPPPEGGRRPTPPETPPTSVPPGPTRPTTPPTPTTPSLGPALSGWDPNKWVNASHTTPKYVIGRILSRYPPTVEGLKQAIPELQAAFPGLTFNGKDKIVVPGLGPQGIDVLQAASTGGVAWQWIDTDAEAAAQRPAAGSLPGAGLPSNADPYTPGSFYGGGGNVGPGLDRMPMGGGMPSVPDPAAPWVPNAFTPKPITSQPGPTQFTYGGPGLPGTLNAAKAGPTMTARNAFTYDPLKTSEAFVMPTGQQALEQDPGYQFRLSQGLKARESSAAQRGLLRTGATLKGLDEFGQEMASQEYGKAFERSFNTYGLNQGVRQSEQAQQFGQSLSAEQQNAAQRLNEFNAQLASQGQEFQHAANQYGINLARQQQGFGQSLDSARFNADNTNRFADRDLQAQSSNQANLLEANRMNNAFGFQAADWNAGQRQQQFQNKFGLYQTEVSRDLAQQGINLTAEQNSRMFSLNAQQQQWMQVYMMNGQSFDQAYKLMLARLQYPA